MPRRNHRLYTPEYTLDELFHSVPTAHRASRIRGSSRAFATGSHGASHRIQEHHARQADFERLVRTQKVARTPATDTRAAPKKPLLRSRARLLAGLIS